MNKNEVSVKTCKNLYKHESDLRRKNIQELDYFLCLNLTSELSINGIVEINLNISNTNDIFLDFKGRIINLIINNKKQIVIIHKKNRIHLGKHLNIGNNKIVIEFENFYASNKDFKGLNFISKENV